jgi:hypothetical protein
MQTAYIAGLHVVVLHFVLFTNMARRNKAQQLTDVDLALSQRGVGLPRRPEIRRLESTLTSEKRQDWGLKAMYKGGFDPLCDNWYARKFIALTYGLVLKDNTEYRREVEPGLSL